MIEAYDMKYTQDRFMVLFCMLEDGRQCKSPAIRRQLNNDTLNGIVRCIRE